MLITMFQSPGAILLKLGPLVIRWYSVMIAIGFLSATAAAARLAKQMGIDPEKLINCALISFIGGLIGARLYFVGLSWPYFQDHLLEIVATWKGGLSIHGGIIGGLVSGLIYCRRTKLPTLRYADIIGSVMPLAQSIGRWGNFFNSEAFGKPVGDDFPLKLFIPAENRPMTYIDHSYFHPTFLYESIWDFLLFLLLYFVLVRKLKNAPGITFMTYVAGYSIGRLLIEPLRVDSILVAGTPAPFVVSAVMLVFSILGAILIFQRHRTA